MPGHVARVGAAFQQRLRGLEQRVPFVGNVRGKGLMLGIEMVADKATKAPLPKTSDIPARVARAAYRRGLMVRVSGRNLILSPPLVISEAELDLLCGMLEAAFDEVAAGAMNTPVLLVGTADTKSDEIAFLREQVRGAGRRACC